jgi:hypothetical protein
MQFMSQPEDRWASLAEELGLPPEPGARPVAGEAPAARATAPPAVHAPPSDKEAVPEVVAGEAAPREPETVGDAVPSGGPEESSEGGRSRSRRRRRKRGRKAENEEPAVPTGSAGDELTFTQARATVSEVDIAVAAVTEPRQPEAELGVQATSEEADEGRERRGRRRRRGERSPDASESHTLVEDSEPNEHGAGTVVEEDNEEVDDLADLNLPSWNELIAGLYRPPDR